MKSLIRGFLYKHTSPLPPHLASSPHVFNLHGFQLPRSCNHISFYSCPLDPLHKYTIGFQVQNQKSESNLRQ
ncbi:hypothetical protein L6452_17305 [Arctium lappa]|uniref:Uncharacterized protein n=1 Tax=Arctium lappa TaxID=4217 RepID=A0ACB9C378_ARCLA|nr:hypothetical protein L6452_17305 [Arctium lappa]